MIKLAFSTNAYLRFSFAEAASRIASIGYQGLELLADVPHAWPAGLLPEAKQGIRAAMADRGLEFSNVNAFMMNAIADRRQPYWYPSFIDPEPNYRQVRIDHTRRALSLCAELGAPYITTEPGGPIAEGQTRKQAIDLFVEVLKPLAEHAHECGVLLLIEPEPGLLLETTDQYLEVAERVNAPSIGLNFDVGHAFCVKEDLPAAIAKLAPQIRHYHVEDINAERVHHHLVPGMGAIDFPEVFRAIGRTGYDGWVTVELYPFVEDPDAAAREAFRVLRPLADATVAPRTHGQTYLQLVRLPNVFTAAADSLAGWLLVTGSFGRPGAWVPLVLASACTYAGGIALNDVFDAEVDRIERPSRPIPSGRVSRTTAAVLGAAFMAAGVALAFASGTRHGGTVELLLVECVIAYNAGIKHSALGPEIMGSCRGLNFLLGMSNAIEFGGPFAWIATVAYGLFVAGVTWISRAEVHFGRQMTILVGAVFQNVALLGLVYAGFLYGFFMEAKGQGLLVFLCGELLLLGLGLAINARTIRALWRPEPAMIQRAVKFGILSLIWLHVGLLLAVRGPSAALAVAIFWLPAAYAGRWIYST